MIRLSLQSRKGIASLPKHQLLQGITLSSAPDDPLEPEVPFTKTSRLPGLQTAQGMKGSDPGSDVQPSRKYHS